MTAVAAPPVIGRPRSWATSYAAMVHWHLASLRVWLAMLAAVQILAGAGFVLGIALFFDHVPPSAALFVCTGVPVINLIMVGLILGPQLVADQKIAGSYEYVHSLPVRRSVSAVAWYTVTLIGGLPAVVIALLIAQARYDLPLHVTAAIVPAMLLTSFAGTMLGYAMGHALSSPMATRLVTQVLVFAIFGFAPILFPPEQLPGWLAAVNWWFPFRHMAVIVRASLTTTPHPALFTSYAIVLAWAAVSVFACARALARRP